MTVRADGVICTEREAATLTGVTVAAPVACCLPEEAGSGKLAQDVVATNLPGRTGAGADDGAGRLTREGSLPAAGFPACFAALSRAS